MATYDSLVSRTDAAGLIPVEYASGVIDSMTYSSVALGTFRRVTMPRAQTEVPVLSVLPSAYWVGESDTGLKQTSEQNWENVTLYARELAVIIPIPEAVVADSTIDLWAEITPRIAEAFGQKIDAATLFGTNAPTAWPDDIVTDAISADNEYIIGTVSGDLLDVDISNAMQKVEDDGFDVNVAYARRNIRGRLRSLRATDDKPIFAQALTTDGIDAIYGNDLRYVSNGAWDDTYAMIVGDRNAAILGVRQDINYRIFTEGVISDGSGDVQLNLMQQDAIALRATMRVAFAVANPVNRVQETASSRFPFAVLTEDPGS